MYTLGIDLGTTFTAAAVCRDGHTGIASLGSRTAAIPSVVLLREDASVLIGEAANRRALTEPDRVAREFKRRFGDSTPIILGGTPLSPEALTARLLAAVVSEVTTREGGSPSAVCLCHPANWGPFKTDLLHQAVRLAGLTMPVTFTTEPEAAAVFYAREQRIAAGDVIAVYDLGGGTFDAAVLRRTGGGFEILGRPEGIERLGGIDVDAAVFNHVAKALGDKLSELDEDDPAAVSAVARLRQECTDAKEALSSDTDVTIPVILPGYSTEVRLTRAELEALVRPALYDSIGALQRAIASAGVTAQDLHSVLLVGGSSRMPLVAQLVGAELGRPVAVDAHPKHAVALGAAWLATGEPMRAPAPESGAPLVPPRPVQRATPVAGPGTLAAAAGLAAVAGAAREGASAAAAGPGAARPAAGQVAGQVAGGEAVSGAARVAGSGAGSDAARAAAAAGAGTGGGAASAGTGAPGQARDAEDADRIARAQAPTQLTPPVAAPRGSGSAAVHQAPTMIQPVARSAAFGSTGPAAGTGRAGSGSAGSGGAGGGGAGSAPVGAGRAGSGRGGSGPDQSAAAGTLLPSAGRAGGDAGRPVFPPPRRDPGPRRPRGMAVGAAFGAVLLVVGLVALWASNRPDTTARTSAGTGTGSAAASTSPSANASTSSSPTTGTGTGQATQAGGGTSTGTLHLLINQPGDGNGGTVLVEPGEHHCVRDCTLTFQLPVTLTLSGQAKAGYLFTPWSGSTCSDVTPCVLGMPRLGTALEVHAGFAKGLLVSVAVQGNGTVSSNDGRINCPGTCAVTYPAGSKVLLHPGDLNTFTGWTGCTDMTSGGGCGVSGVSTGTVDLVASFGTATSAPASTPTPTATSTP